MRGSGADPAWVTTYANPPSTRIVQGKNLVASTSDDLQVPTPEESCSGVVLVPVSSPINPAVDHLADLALWEAELATDPQVIASSLAAQLARVPDPRDPRDRRRSGLG
jgi:hypothetical protein